MIDLNDNYKDLFGLVNRNSVFGERIITQRRTDFSCTTEISVNLFWQELT